MSGVGYIYFGISGSEGDQYWGEWLASKRNGYGRYIWVDGAMYELFSFHYSLIDTSGIGKMM